MPRPYAPGPGERDKLNPPGCGAAWLARLSGGQEVPSSNLGTPTAEGPLTRALRLVGSSHRPRRLPWMGDDGSPVLQMMRCVQLVAAISSEEVKLCFVGT